MAKRSGLDSSSAPRVFETLMGPLKVPSVMVALCAGKPSDGYIYPLHHPKVRFDTDAMLHGAEFFASLDNL